jgi:hypothetical protein
LATPKRQVQESGVGFAEFLDLPQGCVDVLDDDFLNIETFDDFANHGNSIARDEFHAESSAGTVLIVFRMKGQRLIEMHRSDGDSTNTFPVGLVENEFVSHDERDSAESESPLGDDGPGLPRLCRGFVRARPFDFAKDSIVPGDSLDGIGQGSPNTVGGCADRR